MEEPADSNGNVLFLPEGTRIRSYGWKWLPGNGLSDNDIQLLIRAEAGNV